MANNSWSTTGREERYRRERSWSRLSPTLHMHQTQTSSWYRYMNGNLVKWLSKKQKNIRMSTAAAELVALSIAKGRTGHLIDFQESLEWGKRLLIITTQRYGSAARKMSLLRALAWSGLSPIWDLSPISHVISATSSTSRNEKENIKQKIIE